MLSTTITLSLPDFLLCLPFWGGVVVGVVLSVLVVAWAARNFNPFG